MAKLNILVTGGAGYIGSHTVKLLSEKGFNVVVYDNLSNGHREAVENVKFVEGDILDTERLSSLLSEVKFDACIHFAAFIEVGESVKNPLKFYKNNVAGTLNLLTLLKKYNVKNFVFSSTAAVYGNPEKTPIKEDFELKPVNPYGNTKLAVENALRDMSNAGEISYIALRYFNASGADESGLIGESHNPETHLIPLVLKTAKGERESIKIFGTDYPTKDGTCIRDYIHVNDLANAHILALNYLIEGGKSDVFNCGYGIGYSVREIIDTAKKVTGIDFRVEETERREGDPAVLVADNKKIKKVLNWKPQYNDIEYIIQTAWNWEKNKRF
ncbi:UDP-glucose 4-epimerase [Thermotomaculum hydrothermale]|uniref:UDP-glucose 4-epimerase n=1 Tax=Thermotomaculum hydrothermale TaxID=981385 RepID=A0A7R6SZ03_9BACT|nr:UDP-glucose 4-epimerase GalE [Thermotomaculum hydrothermale]BBB33235.1 UDP-glucose 4-epimerase [Thermotomaculum hydrothermale]